MPTFERGAASPAPTRRLRSAHPERKRSTGSTRLPRRYRSGRCAVEQTAIYGSALRALLFSGAQLKWKVARKANRSEGLAVTMNQTHKSQRPRVISAPLRTERRRNDAQTGVSCEELPTRNKEVGGQASSDWGATTTKDGRVEGIPLRWVACGEESWGRTPRRASEVVSCGQVERSGRKGCVYSGPSRRRSEGPRDMVARL